MIEFFYKNILHTYYGICVDVHVLSLFPAHVQREILHTSLHEKALKMLSTHKRKK